MVVLVTGATGLLGNNVVRQLLDEPARVRVLVQTGDRCAAALSGLDVEPVAGDVRDPAAVRRAVRGAGLVVHAAGRVHFGWRDAALQQAVNALGTRHVAQACRAEGARMVHVSSVDTLAAAAAIDEPVDEQSPPGEKVPCSYVLSKRRGEQEFRRAVDQGLDGILVHPSLMLGPWDWGPSSGRMLLMVARGRLPLAPAGGASFCDARDVARGILRAARRGRAGERYVLAGHNRPFLDAWTLFARVCGARPPFRCGARWATIATSLAGRCGDLWAGLSGREGPVNSAAMRMGQLGHYYSSRRARESLGYRNRPLDETVRDAWRWFQEYGYA